MIDADSIHDYLDGDLDEVQKRELAQWLLAAPEHRALFRREVALAATLGERGDWRLWREAMARLDWPLRVKGIVAGTPPLPATEAEILQFPRNFA